MLISGCSQGRGLIRETSHRLPKEGADKGTLSQPSKGEGLIRGGGMCPPPLF